MRIAILVLAIAAAAPPGPPEPENLFRGPARCVMSYLEVVRRSAPHGPVLPHPRRPAAQDYRAARELVAPRALEELERRTARGEDHPLAPWLAAARGVVLESFSLLEVRRAPRGAAVVTVREQWRRDGEATLGVTISEYLVARVAGEWKLLDRRTGEPFQEQEIDDVYAGWFDAPGAEQQQ